ncbi:MAG: hypothetical protein ACSLEL_03260 [Candidatus Malihini olakiniferum]
MWLEVIINNETGLLYDEMGFMREEAVCEFIAPVGETSAQENTITFYDFITMINTMIAQPDMTLPCMIDLLETAALPVQEMRTKFTCRITEIALRNERRRQITDLRNVSNYFHLALCLHRVSASSLTPMLWVIIIAAYPFQLHLWRTIAVLLHEK